MQRNLSALLFLALLTLGCAQTSPLITGVPCATEFGSNGHIYEFSSDSVLCCSTSAQPTLTNSTDCEAYCQGLGRSWVFGYFRNNTYDSCVCLADCSVVPALSNGNYRSLVTTYQNPSANVTDLISSAPDFEIGSNTTQLTLAPNQIAKFRTNIDINGNTIHFVAIPSVSGLSADSILGFTVRDLYDYRTTTPSVTFRNNSFEVASYLTSYNPPVQYKRQSPSSDSFTYTMKNFGNELLVVLSSGNEPLSSWYYSPIASNTEDTITTLSDSFAFDLTLEHYTSFAYESCTMTSCYDSVLNVCENGTTTERKFCHMGCNDAGLDCIQCNSNTCQGTCAVNSTTPQCVCSGTRIGAGCQTDLATSTFHLSGFDNSMSLTIAFDISNCNVGQSCATVSYFYLGISPDHLTGEFSNSCCTASLTFASLDVSAQNGKILSFSRDGDWTCFNGEEMTIDSALLASNFQLSYLAEGSSQSWYWNQTALDIFTQYYCNSDITNLNRADRIIAAVALDVGLAFLCASCAAVVVGFLISMRTSPNGMSVKRKEPLDRGCIPKHNDTMSRSIIAIIVVDVGVVTTFNIIGLIFPVLMATLASGVLLIIMTYQIDQVGARIGRKLPTVHKLQTVQRVFGRISGAFLILLGAVVFILGLAFNIYGLLTDVIYYIDPLFDWFVLAIYLTWTLVMVHFAAGIYVCVCFYYTAARSEEQESIRAHNVEMEEHPDNIEL
jgi:hypothetical protein